MPKFRVKAKRQHLRFGGKSYFPGDLVEMTAEQAARLPRSVEAVASAPPVKPAGKPEGA